jgi:KDO2-lipid IV(A) lauroyltransferase
MAKKVRNRLADYAVYLTVRSVVCVLQMVSPRIAYAIAECIAWAGHRLIKSRRRIALENVRAAFPGISTESAERLVREMFYHFACAIVEMALLPRKLHLTNWRKFLSMDGPGVPAFLRERSVLIVTAHFGNWEMAGFALGLLGFRTYAIARKLDNPYLERYALKFRQRTGQTILFKNDDFDRISAVMKAGGKVATLADQDAGEKGLFVEFFGRPASTHKAIALMAREFDAVILVMGVPRVRRAAYPQRPDFDPSSPLAPLFYRVRCADVIDPREYADDPNALKAITARYTAAIEALIREHPEQYFWLHRRWKHQPKAKRKAG